MRGLIDRLIKIEALWALGIALKSLLPAGLAAMAQIPIIGILWFYIDQTAQIEGWWVYVVVAIYAFSLPVSAAAFAVWVWNHTGERRKRNELIWMRTRVGRIHQIIVDKSTKVLDLFVLHATIHDISESKLSLWLDVDMAIERRNLLMAVDKHIEGDDDAEWLASVHAREIQKRIDNELSD
ncbi:MAG: hypothetical protein RIC85_05375 [Gammaproteobacteria bacterium]|uniref:hypothetical protein n=1 Tax=Thalassobaculum sp. TaxID=2022740 RepID=UPI0032ECA506